MMTDVLQTDFFNCSMDGAEEQESFRLLDNPVLPQITQLLSLIRPYQSSRFPHKSKSSNLEFNKISKEGDGCYHLHREQHI
jgi:hypothetical protein